MLSFVPRQAKDFRLWNELIHDERIATMTIDKMMPKCFKLQGMGHTLYQGSGYTLA